MITHLYTWNRDGRWPRPEGNTKKVKIPKNITIVHHLVGFKGIVPTKTTIKMKKMWVIHKAASDCFKYVKVTSDVQ